VVVKAVCGVDGGEVLERRYRLKYDAEEAAVSSRLTTSCPVLEAVAMARTRWCGLRRGAPRNVMEDVERM
jgi:hypothetical protein